MKKISVFLVLCFIATILITTPLSVHAVEGEPGMEAFIANGDASSPYTDVDQNAEYAYATAMIAMFGLYDDTSNTFRPDDYLTAAEALSFTVRLYQRYHGLPSVEIGVREEGQVWYEPYIVAAGDYNISFGSAETDWNEAVTRGLAAHLFAQAFPAEEYNQVYAVPELPDVTEATQYSRDIMLLYNAGVFDNGGSIGSFNPTSPITRGEAALVMQRMFEPSSRVTEMLSDHSLSMFDIDTSNLGNPYTDLSEDSPYLEGAKYCYAIKVISGTGGGMLTPDGEITEKQLLTICTRIYELYHYYSDAYRDKTNVYLKAIRYGITEENEFQEENGKRPIEKSKALKLLYRTLDQKELSVVNDAQIRYTDISAESDEYSEIDALYRAGVFVDFEDYNRVEPEATVKRGQLTVWIMRLLKSEKRVTYKAKFQYETLEYKSENVSGSLSAYKIGTGDNLLLITIGAETYGRTNLTGSGLMPYPDSNVLTYYARNALTNELLNAYDTIYRNDWTIYIVPLNTTKTVSTPTLEQQTDLDVYLDFLAAHTADEEENSEEDNTENSELLFEFAKDLSNQFSGRKYILDVKGWLTEIKSAGQEDRLSKAMMKGMTAVPEYEISELDGKTAISLVSEIGFDEVCVIELPESVICKTQRNGMEKALAKNLDALYAYMTEKAYTRASTGELGSIQDCISDGVLFFLSGLQ